MEERQLWSMEYFVKKNKVWFMDFHTNDLYEQDLESGMLTWINCLPTENSRFKSHPLCVKWQDDILAIPDFGENIWIYHMKTEEFSKIPIGGRNTKRYGARNPVVCGDDIWIPMCGQLDIYEPRRILHMDAENHHYEWSEIITEKSICLETIYKDGYIYLASSQDNILYVFDVKRNQSESYYIEELSGGIETVCDAGKEIWLSDRTGKIVCWDMILRQVTRTTVLPFAFELVRRGRIDDPFLQSRNVNGKVCYIPAYENPLQIQEVIMFETASLSFQTITFISPEDVESNYILVEFVTDDGKIGIWTQNGNGILLLDTEKGNIVEKKQILTQTDRILLWMRSHPLRTTETTEWDISCFLNIIKDSRLQLGKKDVPADSVGMKIHRTICL